MDEQKNVAAVMAAEVEETNDDELHGARFDNLDRRMRELEAAMADMRTVSAQGAPSGRKTAVSPGITAAAKGDEPNRGAALDSSLSSLSIEQRIAVKSGMMRAGLL